MPTRPRLNAWEPAQSTAMQSIVSMCLAEKVIATVTQLKTQSRVVANLLGANLRSGMTLPEIQNNSASKAAVEIPSSETQAI